MKKDKEIMLRIRVPQVISEQIKSTKRSSQDVGAEALKIYLDSLEPKDLLYYKRILIREVQKRDAAQKQINEAWLEIMKFGFDDQYEFIEEYIRPIINGHMERII